MFQIKKIIRRVTPEIFLSFYHFLWVFFGAIRYNFSSRKLTVIGVTGTNGKTSVCNMVHSLLTQAGFKTGMTTTANFKIGEKEWINDKKQTMVGRMALQKLLRQMVRANCQYAIIETSSEGILQHRQRFIDYDIAIFTNLTPEHLEHHGVFENYRAAKGKLLHRTKGIHIIKGDDENAEYFLNFKAEKKFIFGFEEYKSSKLQKTSKLLLRTRFKICRILNCALIYLKAKGNKRQILKQVQDDKKRGKEKSVGEKITCNSYQLLSSGSVFTIFYNNQEIKFETRLLGKHNIANLLAVICLGLSQDIPMEKIKEGIKNIKPIPGRMEVIFSRDSRAEVLAPNSKAPNFKVIVDYAHDPKSLETVYQTVKELNPRKIIAVLGSCGGGRDKSKRSKLGKLAGEYADFAIITNEDPYDENPQEIIDQVAAGVKDKNKLLKILDRKKAIKKAIDLAGESDIIMVTGKGSEQCMMVGNKKIPWDDRDVVRGILETKLSVCQSENI